MRITLRGFSLGLISFLLLLISVYTRSILLFSLFLSLLLLIVRALNQLEKLDIVRDKLVVERVIENYRVLEGGETEIKLVVENRSNIEIPYIYVLDIVPREIRVIGSSSFRSILRENSVIEYRYRVRVDNPGRHDLSLIRVRYGDSLALFLEELFFERYSYITALPRTASVKIFDKIRSLYPGVLLRGRSLGGMYDLWGFREYTPGDDIRKIYWKGFARTGRVYVREDIGESRPRTLLVIGLTRASWFVGSRYNSYAETLLRLTRSIGEYILNSYGSLDVVVCNNVITKILRGVTSSNRERFLSVFDEIPYRGGCTSIGILLMNLYRASDTIYDLVVITSTPADLITSDPVDLMKYLRESDLRGVIVIPNLDYEKDIGRGITKRISEVISSVGFTLIMTEESFYRVMRE